jgi:hypothetical protein
VSSSKTTTAPTGVERGEHARAIGLGDQRPLGAFQAPDRRVAVHRDHEDVPFGARAVEEMDVPRVEEVEAPVVKTMRRPRERSRSTNAGAWPRRGSSRRSSPGGERAHDLLRGDDRRPDLGHRDGPAALARNAASAASRPAARPSVKYAMTVSPGAGDVVDLARARFDVGHALALPQRQAAVAARDQDLPRPGRAAIAGPPRPHVLVRGDPCPRRPPPPPRGSG